MARAGRELETLVALLEEALRPGGLHIESPDYVEDSITGRQREVDVGIRDREGGSLLAFCECRDRRKVADVTWVEQVVTKARDAKGSPPAVLVSASGFTPAAAKKAEHYGHDVRLMRRATVDEIRRWFKVEHTVVIVTSAALHGCEIRLTREGVEFATETATAIKDHGIKAEIFERAALPPLSPEHFFNEWYRRKFDVITREIPPDGRPLRLSAPTRFEHPEESVRVRTTQGSVPVAQLDLLVEVTRSRRLVPPTRVSSYEGPNVELLAENVEFVLGEGVGTVSVHRLAEGKTVVFFRPQDK